MRHNTQFDTHSTHNTLLLITVVEVTALHNTQTDPLQSECPPSFVLLGPKCYFFGYFKLNWFRALEFCHSFGEGVSLACVESEKENVRLKNWLIHNGDPATGVWLGGSDNGHPKRWAWLPTGQLIQWFDWGPAQPNQNEHCMNMVAGRRGYQWANFDCGFEVGQHYFELVFQANKKCCR